jgi:GntR family transcriptional regulator/MocR family aminotransferase
VAASVREALATMTDADLGYGDPRGVDALRSALAAYLGRVRGVVADPARIVVTCGYSEGLGLVCRALAERGASRIAFEDPCFPEQRLIAERAGLEPVPVAVDDHGLRVDLLEHVAADGGSYTPAR